MIRSNMNAYLAGTKTTDAALADMKSCATARRCFRREAHGRVSLVMSGADRATPRKDLSERALGALLLAPAALLLLA